MRAKTALLALPLAFFVTTGWNASCFGQSDLGFAPSGEQATVAENHSGQVFLASVSSDSQPDIAASDAAENSAPADPAPAPEGAARKSSSHVGIGVKISTLGVGI